MRLHQSHHRNSAMTPNWRRLGLGLVVVLLMSLQGAAAMAHRNAHYQEFEPRHFSLADVAGTDAPEPVNSAPTAQCKLCQSSLGDLSLLPGLQDIFSAPLAISGRFRPGLHADRPPSAPPAVWRVRGPPVALHA
ncbi:hypothetical protein [Maricaulis sp.]|uniref:hypothetical protein n=1 Tax=Maricaulis sp. TaxID=1486257 RepID=UPI003A8FC1E0